MMRARQAEKLQIANMNFIEYDSRLEDVLIEEVERFNGCPNSIIFHKGGLEFFFDTMGNYSMHYKLLTEPGLTRVASYSTDCGRDEKVFNYVVDYCSTPIIHGPPGSQCPEENGNGKLCRKPSLPAHARQISNEYDPINSRRLSKYQRKGIVADLSKWYLEEEKKKQIARAKFLAVKEVYQKLSKEARKIAKKVVEEVKRKELERKEKERELAKQAE
ncbi:hypothetical protein CRE_08791 [Caenorhabditis remanei]|uniref:Uncharacterized protein n=1 Tax=Caenorhabditis remanei TaxID=31234 RepID=E3LHI8_CAERE|nr:hypothetical protein CRE_08791 [Caenorhabditis remanei]